MKKPTRKEILNAGYTLDRVNELEKKFNFIWNNEGFISMKSKTSKVQKLKIRDLKGNRPIKGVKVRRKDGN